jgi:UDP-N-acetylglucosamine:LPS N-acetylglucosamine transferase
MMKNISFIICSNGYGHIKRALNVINELLNQKVDLNINLFCKPNQIEFAKKEVNFVFQDRINFFDEISTLEIDWVNNHQLSKIGYKNWLDALRSNVKLSSSDLIVSDNHLSTCMVFRNTVLMGSFLWHQVTDSTNIEVKEIIENESNFLKTTEVEMICLKDMVMPSVEMATKSIKLPWFTEKLVNGKHPRLSKRILFTGGGTYLTNDLLLKLIFKLSKILHDYEILLDSKLFSVYIDSNNNVKQFSFTDDDFLDLRLIICRPGIGILTDAVKYQIPCLVINDNYNREISHNAKQIDNLGIGISFDSVSHSIEELVECLRESILDEQFISGAKEQISKLEDGGIALAADFLINKIYK